MWDAGPNAATIVVVKLLLFLYEHIRCIFKYEYIYVRGAAGSLEK